MLPVTPSERRCSVCGKAHYARGFCQMHYERWHRKGELGPAESKLMSRDGDCAVDGCGGDVKARGLCNMHYARNRMHGDVHTVLVGGGNTAAGVDHPNWKGDSITYRAAHYRVKSERGSASAYPCLDCGRQARQWSYSGKAADRELTEAGLGDYSPDPIHYDPRCVPCHKKFDLYDRKTR